MNATDKAITQEVDETTDDAMVDVKLSDFASEERLALIASLAGDISALLTEDQLSSIGADCIADYEQDCSDREEWEKTVKSAFKRAAQEPPPEKTFPWKGAANVSFPLLTTAAIQFAARAYPAIVKGDEAVACKVVGRDNGRPELDEMGQPVPAMQMTPEGPQPVVGPDGQPQPMWIVPPGGKAARANRVREYMNTVIFYRMKGWEEDTDTLLHQLPIAGSAFRKVWPDNGVQRTALVPALKLVAPMTAKDCETAPRLTEEIEDQSLNDIIGLQRAGFYRTVTLVDDERDAAPRKLLEQHCRLDLDEDGYEEPYIVTLDHQTASVLRIEPAFAPEDVTLNDRHEVVSITRATFYVKYDFLPSLKGEFYGTGLGHLLEQIGDVVNKAINQMIDAGTAQVAGGGFIGSGVNLQGAGRRSSNIFFQPGVYKTVNVTGDQLRNGIYERTWPGPSAVMFQVLDMMLGAAKDISSIKDVLTGDASNNGQVGTTLALIEQGLQVFTAIYKRVYRSLKEEFGLLFRNIAAYGGEAAAIDYQNVLDDPAADFAADFNATDMDIRPVSDPASVTKLQKMARAQFLGQFIGAPGLNSQEIMRRQFEAADVEDIDELFLPPQPQEPDPKDIAAARSDEAGAVLDLEKAQTERVEREGKVLENLAKSFQAGQMIGMA